MKRTLVIITHPNFENSVVNKLWINELSKYPDQYYIHNLHEVYPDGILDVKKEQALIEGYDHIVFQFPFYWFNCPPLFKTWLDGVLTYGWAYGSESGYKMGNKKVALAVSVGIDEKEYTPEGKYMYTLEQLLAPFEVTFRYIKADYQGFYAYYGIERDSSEEAIQSSLAPYMKFIQGV
ncbi:NAD(P)H-dependent oxidoreductase [Myroides sp. 1354]|uniref:NAD(P)H-dependent oxidoreductase n=1 Tax=unclassified Myroides TaxID=2642485 RepID=UPI002577E667|nr:MULTISPECIES: NAD(P)H-dependent oxidoreductase [unclassified Myroides]MDM1046053.1 NAD(P)H-dependent oxidoreductase [Myroides sp. R163-1]MDM1056989.1 NAD(P)H-dependent oxidoreductase [Myroides sp. 1354]MDM1070184.1 NAD(P)H-dependent oxidoreductase [Myroides sp. 1372]